MYRDNDKASNNTNNRHICVKKNSFRNQLFYHGQRSGDGYITKYLKETNEEDKFCIVARALAFFSSTLASYGGNGCLGKW